MLRGIIQVGELDKSTDIIKSYVKSIKEENTKTKDKGLIIQINFDTEEGKIEMESIDYSKGKEKDYNFVELGLTGKSNQFYVVFKGKVKKNLLKARNTHFGFH
ncbi:MAG: TM1802 family CRISPR-associated protein [candidate division WOR-3 bacterium]|nr:TM1802 family CRISPR-associated protein [candidate division WOR-3 bacterium]